MSALLAWLACAPPGPCSIDAPCAVDGGNYYILEPDHPNGDAIVHLHGAGKDYVTVLEKVNEDLFLDAGFALVLPESADGRWAVSRGLDEAEAEASWLGGLAEALRDERFAHVYLTGHSVGGSMAWYTACFAGEAYDAFAPTSGAFWEPMPAACPSPPRPLRHTHGLADPMVPLSGRELYPGVAQGNVYDAVELLAREQGCDEAPAVVLDGDLSCFRYAGCAEGLELCLHEGGHVALRGWERRAMEWFDAAP